MAKLKELPFTVDSALLRELGQRLVGKPHIALAELVKNAYDADARKATITVEADRIEIFDNGHGMDFSEFQRFWMRIGSTHKVTERVSRTLHRPLTGSKGVGRLAVQFLASQLEMVTASQNDSDSELRAYINWNDAVIAVDLTSAIAKYQIKNRETVFPDGSRHGTGLILSGSTMSGAQMI